MTAEEFLDKYDDEYFAGAVYGAFAFNRNVVLEAMKGFAQEKVKEAVETIKTAIQNSVRAYCDDHTPFYGPCVSCGKYENTLELPEQDEVLALISNSYPLENVK